MSLVTVLKGTDFPGNSRFCYIEKRGAMLCTVKIGEYHICLCHTNYLLWAPMNWGSLQLWILAGWPELALKIRGGRQILYKLFHYQNYIISILKWWKNLPFKKANLLVLKKEYDFCICWIFKEIGYLQIISS